MMLSRLGFSRCFASIARISSTLEVKRQVTPLGFRHGLRHLSSSGGSVIDGKGIADALLVGIKQDVDDLVEQHGQRARPTLAVILVGARPDSEKYVEMKKKTALKLGFHSIERVLPADCSHEELLEEVQHLNANKEVDGILVQLPLPSQCDQAEILKAIDVEKDVDGFHPFNMGRLAREGENLRQKRMTFDPLCTRNAPCTPLGCIVLLEKSGVEIAGKKAVVLGRSNIVGLPVALMLLHKNATVTVCHSRTGDLESVCREADILICAIGKAEMVKKSWVKPGAAVIDVGINFIKSTKARSGVKMVGDVAFDEVMTVPDVKVTPVPGGVGPMTICLLMKNALENAKARVRARQKVTARPFDFDSWEKDQERSPDALIRRRSRPVKWKYGTSFEEP